MLKDYDSRMFYHPVKANVVADALSRKSRDDDTNSEELMDQLSQHFTMVHVVQILIYSQVHKSFAI